MRTYRDAELRVSARVCCAGEARPAPSYPRLCLPSTFLACLSAFHLSLHASCLRLQRDVARRRREEEVALERKNPLQLYVELLGSQDEAAWKEWLIGMGQAADVPKLFKHSGKIRNKHLSKRDTEKLVKEIWKERMADPGAGWGTGGLAGVRTGEGLGIGEMRVVGDGWEWVGEWGRLQVSLLSASLLHTHSHTLMNCCLVQLRQQAKHATCWSLCSTSCRSEWASSTL